MGGGFPIKVSFIAAAAAGCVVASAAVADPTVDGTINPGEYTGALLTHVQQVPGTDPTNQYPSSPGANVENVSYDVYYTSDVTNIYVALQSAATSNGLAFTNLYFDTNNAAPGGAGSDIAFEVFNNDAFVPATGTFSTHTLTDLGGVFTKTLGTAPNGGDIIELSIPWTVFTTNATGLGQPLVAAGGGLELRTSQSFNYAAVTGDGVDAGLIPRFGFQYAPNAGAVPEPASWAMMIAGFGLVGAGMRRSNRVARFA